MKRKTPPKEAPKLRKEKVSQQTAGLKSSKRKANTSEGVRG